MTVRRYRSPRGAKPQTFERSTTRSGTIDEIIARQTATQPYMPSVQLLTESTAQVHAFIVQMYVVGMQNRRTGWPEGFPQLADQLSQLRLSRTHVPVDEVMARTAVHLLGWGFKGDAVTAILQDYCWDIVYRVQQSVQPGDAQALAQAHAEWFETALTRQTATTFRVSPEALSLLSKVAQNPNAGAAAQGGAGQPGPNDGFLTRSMYSLGRFAAAPGAGAGSWWGSSTVTKKTSDSFSVPGVASATTETSTTTTRKPAEAPTAKSP